MAVVVQWKLGSSFVVTSHPLRPKDRGWKTPTLISVIFFKKKNQGSIQGTEDSYGMLYRIRFNVTTTGPFNALKSPSLLLPP